MCKKQISQCQANKKWLFNLTSQNLEVKKQVNSFEEDCAVLSKTFWQAILGPLIQVK